MSLALSNSSDLSQFDLSSGASLDSLTIPSSLLSEISLDQIYSKLNPGGRLEIQNVSSSIKKSLIFSGFCKVSESAAFTEGFKPTNTSASALSSDWQKALEGQELVDEDNLLAQDEEYKTLASEEDCLTRAKPCKNCTCGRADELKKLNQGQTLEMSSSCGRCNLGDAFRCAGCPFRGTPAFVPGQKVDSDLTAVVSETAAKIQGGKVKIDI